VFGEGLGPERDPPNQPLYRTGRAVTVTEEVMVESPAPQVNLGVRPQEAHAWRRS
jgi:hypothetical protein